MDVTVKQAITDRHSMKKLLEEYEPFVFRIAYHLTAHRQDAEDISQEVLYKICTKLHTFKGDSALRTWIYTLVINTHKDFLRKKVRHNAVALPESFMCHPIQHDFSTRLFIEDLIKDLSAVDKQVFVLRFQNELSVQEVADIMNMSVSNVKTRVFRLREKLRGLILQGGEAL